MKITKTKVVIVAVLLLIVIAVAVWIKFAYFSGRTPSRVFGESMAQTVEIPGLKEIISVSFDRRGEKTVKDITFLADDGYVYSQEVIEFSILEGSIRWVPYGEGSSLIQSRGPSRLFNYAVDLELPENFKRIVNVDIGYDSKNERVKNLVYLTNDGRVMAKEYFEGILDRHFGGYMEVKRK